MLKILLKFTVFFIICVKVSIAETLNIAAAANIQYALDELITEFKRENPDVKVNKIVSSSGKLTAQIMRNAPFDLFLSADMKYPIYLYKKGYSIIPPKVYAQGILVLWSNKNIKFSSIQVLVSKKIKKIAIPNPKTAPYGRAARESLVYYGLYNKVKNKLIYGESVGQASNYIYEKIVDIGFTAKSIVLSPKIRNKGHWIEIPVNTYNPINQGIVILKHGSKNPYAKKFFNFILSNKGKEILKKYGYKVNKD